MARERIAQEETIEMESGKSEVSALSETIGSLKVKVSGKQKVANELETDLRSRQSKINALSFKLDFSKNRKGNSLLDRLLKFLFGWKP